MKPDAQWVLFLQQALTGVCAVAVAQSTRTGGSSNAVVFLSAQGVIANVTLFATLLMLRQKPYTAAQQWRTAVTAGLFAITAVASLVSLTLRFAGQGNGSATAWALGLLPLALACLLVGVLLRGWWKSLLGAAEGKTGGVGAGCAESSGGAARWARPLRFRVRGVAPPIGSAMLQLKDTAPAAPPAMARPLGKLRQ